MSMVWTQFGPVPRDVLEVTDHVVETENSRGIVSIWRLKTPMTFTAAEKFEALMDFGGERKVLQPGEVLELKAGQFMKNSGAVDVLMPQSVAGGQAKQW